jgi:hypothetical protein
LGGQLIYEPVGERIAEGNANFENIHSSTVEGHRELLRGGQIRISGANIDDKSLFTGGFELGEFLDDTVHVSEVSSFRFEVSSRFTARSTLAGGWNQFRPWIDLQGEF